MNYSPVQIYLNSKYCTLNLNGTLDNSDMVFYFDHPITKPKDYTFALSITSFVFPLSYTLVNESNNTLVINGTSYTITQGNYNAMTLQS